jgi:hypothetical protein
MISMTLRYLLFLSALLVATVSASAATMWSTKQSFMTAGTFYGPGRLADSTLFDATISNISFPSPLTFVTPLGNNGGAEPNLCGERELRQTPTGLLSDNLTKINENVDVCPFVITGKKILVAVVDGGGHQGEQIAVALSGGEMLMTMDFALDLGIGTPGIIRMPFNGTTGEVEIPLSLQTQLHIPGGVDRAGSLKSGAKIRGRFGDFNHDGMLDGAIVVAGNIPLTSVFMPGAPYALIRYFETDIPYDGHLIKLPGEHGDKNEPPRLTVIPPTPATAGVTPSGRPR